MFYCILLYSFAVYTHVRAATCANGGDGRERFHSYPFFFIFNMLPVSCSLVPLLVDLQDQPPSISPFVTIVCQSGPVDPARSRDMKSVHKFPQIFTKKLATFTILILVVHTYVVDHSFSMRRHRVPKEPNGSSFSCTRRE